MLRVVRVFEELWRKEIRPLGFKGGCTKLHEV